MAFLFGNTIPERAIIGLIGDSATVISAELDSVIRESPSLVVFDYSLDVRDPLSVLEARRNLLASRQAGATILLASWNEQLLREMADEVWWIVHGKVFIRGDPGLILDQWRKHTVLRWRESQTDVKPAMQPSSISGDGRARIVSVELRAASGQTVGGWLSGEEARIRVSIEFISAIENPVIGILIRTRIGLNVYGTNTELERLALGPRAAGDRIQLIFTFRCDLCPGEYTLTVASHDPDGIWHQWLEDVVAFTVADARYTAGVANLRARAEWALY